jgi:hypothetical protein
MTGAGGVDAERLGALVSLDARSWARTLIALREVEALGERARELLARPTSELATGPARRALCEQVLLEPVLLDAMLVSDALPREVHDLLVATGTGSVEATTDEGVTHTPVADKERGLRRELAQLRRQRDGAEARAVAAEARAESRDTELRAAQVRIATLESQLEGAADELAQAVARAERRSDARSAALESELAGARSELERTSRRAERDAAALAALRGEHAETSSELEVLRAALPGDDGEDGSTSRPLPLPLDVHPDTTEAARWLLGSVTTLLVDGYNVSLNLRAGQELEAQRRWLIERLRSIAARGQLAPVVVFDGDQASPSSTMSSGVEIRFTAAASTADDDIVFTVAVTTGPVLVVTDDRELRERVTSEGANVVGGRAFLGALDR